MTLQMSYGFIEIGEIYREDLKTETEAQNRRDDVKRNLITVTMLN